MKFFLRKKTKFAEISLAICAFVCIAPHSDQASAITSKRLPVLHHIGVIPLQWQSNSKSEYALRKARKNIETAFSLAVRMSKRFSVLSDNLVAELWDSPAGRSELKRDYELSAFANIAAAPLEDTVILVVRLLEPDLTGLMQESETLERRWLESASYDQVEEKVSSLVYKLTNRIPVDVTITSVQGKYVTFSGGQDKGIHEGDILKIVRSQISDRHPATKFWMKFSSRYLGKAEIIESKQHTSVARLLDQVKENIIEIGDGSKIGTIAGRTRFARKKKAKLLADLGKTIIVPPLYDSETGLPNHPRAQQKAPNSQIQTKSKSAMPPGSRVKITPSKGNSKTKDLQSNGSIKATPGRGHSRRTQTSNNIDDNSKTRTNPNQQNIKNPEGAFDFSSPFAFSNMTNTVSKFADRITLHTGQHIWKYNGPGSTGSKFALFLPVNTVGARIIRQVMPNIKYGMGGGIGGGKTTGASTYFTYDSNIRVYWEGDLRQMSPILKKFKVGGQANFSGLSINGKIEKFGGGDWIQLGFFGGISGTIEQMRSIDWYGEFSVTPITIGKIGYNGSKKSISTSLGWAMRIGGYLPTSQQQLEWGAGFEYSGINAQDSSNNSLGIAAYNFLALARYRFY